MTLKTLRAWLWDWAKSRTHTSYPPNPLANQIVVREREQLMKLALRRITRLRARELTARGKQTRPTPISRPPDGAEMWARVRPLDLAMKRLLEQPKLRQAIRVVQQHYLVGPAAAAKSMQLTKPKYYALRIAGERALLAAFVVRSS